MHFFPESTAVLRTRLFADLDAEELTLDGEGPDLDDETTPAEQSRWIRYEQAPFSHKVQDYHERRHSALADSIHDLREGKCLYSRRIVHVWAYQRGVLCSLERHMASYLSRRSSLFP